MGQQRQCLENIICRTCLIPTTKSGRWTQVPPNITAQTRECSSILNKLIMVRSCTWEIVPRPRSMVKEKRHSEDNFWDKVDLQECIVYAKHLQKVSVKVVFCHACF